MADIDNTSLALAESILYGTREDVANLIKGDIEIDELDPYGFTPLVEAAIANKLDIAELLLQNRANVNEPDLLGRTALHWAADNDNVPLCQLLLDYKANPNAYSSASQPILVTPLLRDYDGVKNLLYEHGADLNFAQDFINAKLLGHRYSLTGQTDIVNSEGQFIEIDFEGFYLEFTLSIIYDSLKRYKNNFAARHLRDLFVDIQKVINALAIGAELIKYQQYTINIKDHTAKIDKLLNHDVMVIPVVYQGHAITFVRCGLLLAKCDRGEYGRKHGTVNIYRIQNTRAFTTDLVKKLIYSKQTPEFVHSNIDKVLGLQLVTQLPLKPQYSGNCSWANVEACVPATLFLLQMTKTKQPTQTFVNDAMKSAIQFYKDWREWDKDRALYDCIQSFYASNAPRRASKVTILAAILFQRCHYGLAKDMERAEKILAVLTLPRYNYILKSYYDVFAKNPKTAHGRNLKQIMEYYDVYVS